MLTAYLDAAMRQAHYELLADQPDTPYCGTIPGLSGVLAVGATLEECRDELRGALELWVLMGVRHGEYLPVIEGVDLNLLSASSQVDPRAALAEVRAHFAKLGPVSPSVGEQADLDRQSRADLLEGNV